ncbi:SCP2 sterol-binding domain-containing protein [Neptunomonas japonica]|uniref:SCP2 sterol-binding domain-containing protein n=1 Tax=Neptunomonas japonica TaxID=417574 RepID=UPI000412CB7A|nr:SCP2 sterol-binding domain-containing protein [Neptunomonas japonica]
MSSDITVTRVIEKLPSRFQADAAGSLDAIFQFLLEDDDDFYISIKEQTCTTQQGEHQDPSITLLMDADTFIKVVTGEQDGMSAFLKGQLRAEGNVMLATKLGKLFKNKP